ncbi:helix-turn-helix transcriptional regulator [Pigmentiphaga litoralis]|uniref:helix-turn-helix transcriptional regulator n=1 Tax=Pigmentiphaga litoralis TaxID=516702 RepID=UPI003B43A23D
MSMTRAALTAYNQLILTIYRRAQDLPVQAFQDAVLDDLKALVAFDSSMWGTATLRQDGIDIHSIHLHNSSYAMLEAYEKVKHEDTLAQRVATQPRATLAFNADDVLHENGSMGLRRLAREFGHENGIITSDIHPATRFVHWISLYRRDPKARCQPDDIDLVAQVAPHIMQALAINRVLQFDRGISDLARAQWSVAIADGRGLLYHADPAFLELLDAEWPGCHASDRLPVPVREALRNGNERVIGRHVVIVRSLEHGVLFLRARRRHPVDDLTPAELKIARLLAQGLTHKEVAKALNRSPETVRGHLKAVFAKLGIGSVVLLNAQLCLRD